MCTHTKNKKAVASDREVMELKPTTTAFFNLKKIMKAEQYISFFDGNKQKAISHLEKAISLYENSTLSQRPKTVKRFQEYNSLLLEIKANNDEYKYKTVS